MAHDVDAIRERIATVPHWWHRIEVAPGVVTPGGQDCERLLELLQIPDDLDGMRVLDIGTRDGYYAFEMERRGAEVLAIDHVHADQTGFSVVRDIIGSKVEFKADNVYNLDPDVYGTFDLILFSGVLYHLRHPLLALDKIWDVSRTGTQVIVETHVIDEGLVDEDGNMHALTAFSKHLPGFSIAQFYPGSTLGNDFTCHWAPNMTALVDLMTAAGFDTTRSWQLGTRGGLNALARDLDPEGQRAVDSAAQQGVPT